MRLSPSFLAASLAAWAFVPCASAQVEVDFEDNPIPDLFAALMTVTLSSDIATASFTIDNGDGSPDDTELNTFRVPWNTEVEFDGHDGSLYLEVVGGVLWAEDRIALDTPSGEATVREDWLAFGAAVGVGWNLPISERWRLRPGVSLSLGYLENDADYNAAGEAELAPSLDGILVNWDAWAVITAASLTAERPRDTTRLDVGASGRYVLARTEVFNATDEFQEGHDTSEFLVFRADVGAPLAATLRDEPLGWDVFGGWVGFVDVDDDALGFDEFYELGAGLTFRALRGLPRLRLGGALIYGPDVTGWSLGIGLAD